MHPPEPVPAVSVGFQGLAPGWDSRNHLWGELDSLVKIREGQGSRGELDAAEFQMEELGNCN